VLTALYLFIGWFEFMLVQAPLAATSFIFMGWGSFGSVIEPLAACSEEFLFQSLPPACP